MAANIPATVQLSDTALVGVEPRLLSVEQAAALPTTVRLGRLTPPGRPSVPRLEAFWDVARVQEGALPTSTNRRAAAAVSLARVYLNDQLGDCHDAETEVLTEIGWQKWPNYDGRSMLGTMNRDTGLLEFQQPLGLKRREHDGPMIYGSHKSLDFAVTPNHGMYFRRYDIPYPYVPGKAGYGPTEFAAAGNLPGRCMLPGATTGFMGTGLRRLAIGDRVWDGDDLIRLLAVIVSDGYVSNGETNRNRIGFCCFRDDRRDMIAALAYRLGIKETSRRGVWELRDWDMAQWLRVNIYQGSGYGARFKRVPDLIKVAEQRQIEEFLVYFGDQTISNGSRQFFSSSKRLIDDLQELDLRAGKRTTVHERPARGARVGSDGREYCHNGPSYMLHECQKREVGIHKLSRLEPHVRTEHYKGEVFCATVPNSTLVTRRQGKVLISSNCVIAGKMHSLGLWSGSDPDHEGPALVLATDEEVRSQYQGVCGPGDQGCYIPEVLNYFRSQGMLAGGRRYKIDAYVAVDWRQVDLVKTALYVFGTLTIGINLPSAWTSSSVWDQTTSRIVGGHDVACIDFGPDGVYVSSWGRIYLITWRAFTSTRWLEECYALLAPLWYGSDRLAPCGIDALSLASMLAQIGQGQLPPLPDPVTPPVPPPPPPPPAPADIATLVGLDSAGKEVARFRR